MQSSIFLSMMMKYSYIPIYKKVTDTTSYVHTHLGTILLISKSRSLLMPHLFFNTWHVPFISKSLYHLQYFCSSIPYLLSPNRLCCPFSFLDYCNRWKREKASKSLPHFDHGNHVYSSRFKESSRRQSWDHGLNDYSTCNSILIVTSH